MQHSAALLFFLCSFCFFAAAPYFMCSVCFLFWAHHFCLQWSSFVCSISFLFVACRMSLVGHCNIPNFGFIATRVTLQQHISRLTRHHAWQIMFLHCHLAKVVYLKSASKYHFSPLWTGVLVVTRGSTLGLSVIKWLECVVGSLLCSERCFSGYSRSPLS